MGQITLILNHNRILSLDNLKKLSITYYPKYGLYGLYYDDENVAKKLIYSSDDFFVLLKIEKIIAKAYNNHRSILRI